MLHVEPEGPAASVLLIELLTWVTATPRTYAETMEAWRTSCPRMPIWEDAIRAGLVEVWSDDDTRLSGSFVRLTSSGRALLAGRAERAR